jgi:hypothetical protein
MIESGNRNGTNYDFVVIVERNRKENTDDCSQHEICIAVKLLE